ncbi:hypothetical protein [Streptomyces sp. ID05-47C]|uniref:hypothetical protein n=1 Tax=Streptomyces sp. ID05-47C TaxID=3028665 RepID=UPI0029A7380B|nr:hypothetical protein [Streptomyces sp. ID05-47C]MDX3569748.1 hypothetical protein [Streptomyces sp. ID05-47C]
MSDKQRHLIEELVSSHGRTYAQEAGIRLKNTPQPLYRTLVLAHLLSARIRASTAVAAARALSDAGMRDPRGMAEATWQQRVDALGRGGYRRYDERTATQLGEAADASSPTKSVGDRGAARGWSNFQAPLDHSAAVDRCVEGDGRGSDTVRERPRALIDGGGSACAGPRR